MIFLVLFGIIFWSIYFLLSYAQTGQRSPANSGSGLLHPFKMYRPAGRGTGLQRTGGKTVSVSTPDRCSTVSGVFEIAPSDTPADSITGGEE